jgi:SpoVK/Ycf46/Vps4 family AAA+-type ATPase
MEDTSSNKNTEPQSWPESNRLYLQNGLSWLRLLLRRRVLWLRRQWKSDPMQNYQGLVISDAQAETLLDGEDLAGEARFYREDSGAAEITRAIQEVEKELEDQSRAMLKREASPAIDRLTEIFGLNGFDRTVLLLCLAPEIEPAFERLYAYVQDDVTRKYVTPQLALSLFKSEAGSKLNLRQSFLPEAPLFRFRLVHREIPTPAMGGQASLPLRIDPRVGDFLQGMNHLDEKVAGVVKRVPPSQRMAPTYEEIVRQIKRLFERDDEEPSLPVINFTGPTKTAKKDVASTLCQGLGIGLFNVDAKKLHASGLTWQEMLAILERECLLFRAAVFIDASEMEGENDPSRPFLESLIEGVRILSFIGSAEPWPAERETFVVAVPKLSAGEQAGLWKEQLGNGGAALDGEVDTVVAQFDFEADGIAKAVTSARTSVRMRDGKAADLTLDDLWSACRKRSQNGLERLAQRIAPCYSWEDIVLPKEIFEQIRDIAAQVAHRSWVYERWGFGAKLNRGRGISALFSGPSGTGKTMAAEVLANHLKLDLYRIDLSAVVSKYIGETEKNLRRVFDAAEDGGAILFFDEADALFGKRSEVKDSHDRYANIEVNYLLQRMEDYRGLAILATNMKSLLDQAFLRRLRFQVDFPFPDAPHRQKIWEGVFPPGAAVGQIDYRFLTRLEITGGSIRNIALNAAFLAADDRRVIEMNHMVRAIKREYAKIEKLVLESEFGPYYQKVKQ